MRRRKINWNLPPPFSVWPRLDEWWRDWPEVGSGLCSTKGRAPDLVRAS